jgi:hypothetical protein
MVPRPPEPPPPPPPVEPPLPTPDPLHCPRCGAPHDLYQEYCLECGLRLPPPFPVRREIWTRESPVWLWAALLALLLVAAAAGAIVAVAATEDDEKAANRTTSQAVTTAPTVPIIPTGETITIAPPPTTGITTLPTTSIVTTTGFTTTTAATTTTTGTTTTGLTAWPAGKDGFTVVLKSVPTSQGRGEADAAAQTARTNGLPQVGVLNSSDFSSLTPGYYVAFSGIYDTEAQAVAALPNARSKGFPTAYIREVRD